MYVRKKLGGRNIINKEKSEIEQTQNAPQQDNNIQEDKNVSVEVNNFNNEHKQPEPEKLEGGKKKQVRCKKWPQCKADNCEFAHPTETVIRLILIIVSVLP